MGEECSFLAWFLGPKAENAAVLEQMLSIVLQDYCHWRRNYFPGDSMLITRKLQRQLETDSDQLHQNLLELLAALRRNFPFYSPRYFAHMLSDVAMPSLLGYLAGMLYNPNNVTPEAAPVTVDLEIEACNTLLEMLGFSPPPEVPVDLSPDAIDEYKKKLQSQFGWAHLTHGGTTANLEALWVARTIKYAPLAIWDVAKQEQLTLEVKLPSGRPRDIRELEGLQLLHIRPNEAIYLLARYVDAVRSRYNLPLGEASQQAYKLLNLSEFSLNRGLGALFRQYPPVVFVSGTAHYSVRKASDVLGIGQDNVEDIETDTYYRLDIVHLKQRLQAALGAGRIPVAVIPIVGTTEEGAVDPVHKVLDLRRELENEQDVSFWVHVDAAWGGYIRSIFHLTEEDEARAAVARLPGEIALGKGEDLRTWTLRFLQHVRGQAIHSLGPGAHEPTAGHELPDGDGAGAEDAITSRFKSVEKRLLHLIETDALREYLAEVSKLASKYITPVSRAPVEHLTLQDRVDLVSEYVSDTIRLEEGRYARDLQIRWGSLEVCKALLAMSQADSATVDPHKMGYVNYPCGLVAFANDRVRHFVLQKAPYITSVRQDVLVHMPPKHIAGLDSAPKEEVEAFAPFILEGSRPGAAATALWLTVKTIPPTMRGSGALVRASLIAARELYEWLVHWSAAQQHNRVDVDYQFVPLTVEPPDTNVVVFAIKKATSNSLVRMNQLTGMVYQRFTIQAELGEREYSYSQPFFLSKTTFERPRYAFSSLQPILERHFRKSYMDKISSDYQQVGLTVLRATVMNPYICLLSRHTDQHILHEFISELARAASESVRSLD